MNVLCFNSGSSSLKSGLYHVGPRKTETLFSTTVSEADPAEAMRQTQELLAGAARQAPDAIGHRVVHGGPTLRRHCVIDEAVLRELEAACAFAPLHGPAALSVIRSSQQLFPGVAQIACFDTTFHAEMPDVARVLPIARDVQTDGIQRYGFHGLSCESIVHQLAGELPDRLVIAHLGNGASVTAVRAGRSIDTSMGLTPSGGLIMGTRSGDLDPGLLVYLMRERDFDVKKIEELVDRRSGLLGISGVSSDMRRLHEAAPSNASARLAIEMFCYAVRKQVAAMMSALGGLDLLVFTGGIGENHPAVRSAICGGLACFGVSDSMVRVIASQEDEQIARHAWSLCSSLPLGGGPGWGMF